MSTLITEFDTYITSLTLASESSQHLSMLAKLMVDMGHSNASLVSEIESRADSIDNTTTLENLVSIVKAYRYVNPNKEFVVNSYSDLLTLTSDLTDGTVVYLEEYRIPVILTGGVWRTFDNRPLPIL